ncbi:MAG: hypothetical protein JWM40_661 [Frankiales bacterium]|nr:hypothetical protein [Frankiales bacterium]
MLTTEQAANAATIAAVGKRMGVANHGVTVALATAFQESALRNLDYGDRDSLGLFQQRPSQGWGTAADIQTPYLAAAEFYRHLIKVRGWQSLSVTDAAQRVQHSGSPDAYAQWEDAARTLAKALTGEVPAGIACHYEPSASPSPVQEAALRAQAVRELGPGGLSRALVTRRAWITASWLVAQAKGYGLARISMSGQSWTAKRGTWQADTTAHSLTWS